MDIFELLSFDFAEFVTSPEGILIIVGILLLIVGIVMLFMGKGKNKETATSVAPVEPSVPEPTVVENTPVIPVVTPAVEPTVPTPVEPVVIPTVTENVATPQETTPIIVPEVLLKIIEFSFMLFW